MLAVTALSVLAFHVAAPLGATHTPLRVPAAPVVASRPALASRLCRMQEDAPPAPSAPSAYIEFIIGVPEPCVPDVSLTRSRDGTTGVATFTFDNPSFLAAASAELGETTGEPQHPSACETGRPYLNARPRYRRGFLPTPDARPTKSCACLDPQACT